MFLYAGIVDEPATFQSIKIVNSVIPEKDIKLIITVHNKE